MCHSVHRGGLCLAGSLSVGVSVWGGLCLGGGSLSGGSLSRGVSVQGVSVKGGLPPLLQHAGRTHPTGIHSYFILFSGEKWI